MHECYQKIVFWVKNHKESKGFHYSCKVIESGFYRICFLDLEHPFVNVLILETENWNTTSKSCEVFQHTKAEHCHISTWWAMISYSRESLIRVLKDMHVHRFANFCQMFYIVSFPISIAKNYDFWFRRGFWNNLLFGRTKRLPVNIEGYWYQSMSPKDDVTYLTISIIPLVEIAVISTSVPSGKFIV